MFGVYWALLLAVSDFVTSLENVALRSVSGWAKLMLFVVLAWCWATRRTRSARAAISSVRFEEHPEAPILTLNLRQAPGGS